MGVTWSEMEDGKEQMMPSSYNKSSRPPKSRHQPRSSTQQHDSTDDQNAADTEQSSATSPVRTSGRARKVPKKLQEEDDDNYETQDPVKKSKSSSSKNRVDTTSKKRPIPVKENTLAAGKSESRRPTKKARGSQSSSKSEHNRRIKDDDSSNHPPPANWEENYDKLVAYHKKFGHSNVPQNDVHGKLARWCYLQKRQRELRRLGASEIRLLDRMDFDWTYVRKTGKRPTFEDKCRELKAFQKKYGDCDVPVSGKHILLGQWLYCMKRRRLGVYKRCRQLTQDQIDQLEAIGINWAFSWGDNTSAVNERNSSSDSSDESDGDSSLE